MMQLKSLQLKNFLSYQRETFYFGEGLFLIKGWDKDRETANGSGKSGILDAICWGLTGETPRKIHVESIPNKDNPKDCEVEVVFFNKGKTYRINRGRSPNFLNFYVDEEIKKGATLSETQSIIEETLGISYRLFINSLYFSQGANTQFLTANDNTKKELLTELLDLSIFDKVNDKVHIELKIKKELHNTLLNNIKFLESDIDFKSNFYQKILSFSEDFEQMRSHQLLKLQDDLKETVVKAQENKNKLFDSIKATKERIQKIEGQISSNQQFTALAEGQINFEVEQLEKYLKVRDNAQLFADKLKQSGLERINSFDLELAKTEGELKAQEKDILRRIEEVKRIEVFPDHHCKFCFQVIDRQVMANQIQRLKNETHQFIISYKEKQNAFRNDQERRKVLAEQLNQEYLTNTKELDSIQKHVNKTQGEVNQLKEELSQKINMIKNLCGALELEKHTLNNLNEKFASLETMIVDEVSRIKNDIEEITNKKNEYAIQLAEIEAQINVKRLQLSDHEKDKGDKELEISQLQFLYDAFGNKGVKAYVFERIVNEINLKTNDYINQLFDSEISIQYEVTNTKNGKGEVVNKFETKIFRGEDEIELGSFSGGEKRRLILATDLALSQIIQNRTSKSMNFLFFDEYFEGLDESGREKVMLLLGAMTKNNTILIIDHNTQFQNLFDKTITILKEGNISRASEEGY